LPLTAQFAVVFMTFVTWVDFLIQIITVRTFNWVLLSGPQVYISKHWS